MLAVLAIANTTAASSPHRVPEDVIGLHRGLKTLPIIGPMLSRNQGVITLNERVANQVVCVGANGRLAVIVEAWSRGPASTNCWPGTHCHRSRFSMATRREGISLVKNRMWEICTSQDQEVEVGSIRFRMGRTL